TKDTASQEVKKDVSSLRYISLPNWAHDALLEFSSSKHQDHCSTKVPKGSGNTNPTAFTPNLLTDHIETLTVETLIPTISSPVLTAYSTDSHDSSSDARLISKRVLKNKKDERGIVTRNKARLVAQGHTQEEWIDYDEVFAPVARIKAIRLFLAYASFMGFTVYQMDVKSAFLYGTIDEEVYSDVRSSNTPMDKENPWGKDGTGKDVDLHLYRSMIGSFMYLTTSRPDILFAICAYARHQVTPKECHLHAVKRIFRYLKGHPKLGLWYPKDSPFDLTIVATSTTEAEYVAAASCCGQVLWIQNQLLDYGSPVPTACLNDSPEPSSDARIIPKRVANQEETPSLDNILSLTNRFEDILGVTTSSDEAIGVEADVSNMETTISASPTPILRIHKDHPKSQIIVPVDTPIQTRHKSKEMYVKSAFLYGTIDEEVYVMQPPGF
nr:hypothetical protein [Tanacetum cinerariifolium]